MLVVRLPHANDSREVVAEVSEGFAVAVIDRSQPHFHLRMRETYRVLHFIRCLCWRGSCA